MRILLFLFIYCFTYYMTILSQLNYLGDDDTVPNDHILG